MCDRIYFYRSRGQVFRVRWRWYTLSINVSTWFIIFLGCLYFVWRFGTALFWTSNQSRRRICLRQHIRIWNLICSNGFRSYPKLLKLHYETIGHLYDIDIFVQFILSFIALICTNYLTYNFNSRIFFKNFHWLLYLDWLLEIQTDPGFFQNPIWE